MDPTWTSAVEKLSSAGKNWYAPDQPAPNWFRSFSPQRILSLTVFICSGEGFRRWDPERLSSISRGGAHSLGPPCMIISTDCRSTHWLSVAAISPTVLAQRYTRQANGISELSLLKTLCQGYIGKGKKSSGTSVSTCGQLRY